MNFSTHLALILLSVVLIMWTWVWKRERRVWQFWLLLSFGMALSRLTLTEIAGWVRDDEFGVQVLGTIPFLFACCSLMGVLSYIVARGAKEATP